MSATVLVNGVIFRTPEQRPGKGGGTYALATLKTREGDAVQYWRVLAFNATTQAEIMRLDDGDGVAVQGALRAEIYKPEHGEPRVSLNIMAERAIGLRTALDVVAPIAKESTVASHDSALTKPIAKAPRKKRGRPKKHGELPPPRSLVDPDLNDEVPW